MNYIIKIMIKETVLHQLFVCAMKIDFKILVLHGVLAWLLPQNFIIIHKNQFRFTSLPT